MLSQQVLKLEEENQRLRELLKRADETIPKPKQCQNCKHYIQHYARVSGGNYHKIYAGHCTCKVPMGQRKGKKDPIPEDTCLCFEEGLHGE